MKKATSEFNEIFGSIQKSVIDVAETIDKQSEQVFYFTGFMNMLINELIDYELKITEQYSGSLHSVILNQLDKKLQERLKHVLSKKH
ncbi:hypothetical protein [Piscirickettsia salmonis]|nr:hypothetical protein [Piscirickettsia salmonis]APS59061.1 hypothetical protein AVI52_17655 [Piscirickettsia salmonis]ERL61866.1 hypothetical protein K661_01785 [Piscirickettsia salmonis LF-89 = ATCC VR-1361]PEQ16565.1 hypothetical protein X973_06720 [Piscirickettsia salmonis]QIX57182.1 hypothetical protein GW536_17220 [Piscirickettsia salmonis]